MAKSYSKSTSLTGKKFMGRLKKQGGVSHAVLPGKEKKRGHDFLISVHPLSWEFIPGEKTQDLNSDESDGGEWVPSISIHPKDPGVNGVAARIKSSGNAGSRRTRTEIDISAMLNNLRSQGRIVVEPGDPCLLDILPGGQYIAEWDTRAGVGYFPVWLTPDTFAGETLWITETEILRPVQRALKEKVGEYPHPRLIERRIKKLEHRIEDAEAAGRNRGATHRSRLKTLQALRETLDEARDNWKDARATSPVIQVVDSYVDHETLGDETEEE